MKWGGDRHRGDSSYNSLKILLTDVDISPGSLEGSVFCNSLATTAHVKLVSAVLRGERVRMEDWVVERATVEMMMRPPDSIILPSLSCQVKA